MRKILHFFQHNIQHAQNFFKKKYTHAGSPVNTVLPRIVYAISLSKFSNLRHKNDKTLSIQHYYII